ncbi:MAG: glycyl-radical enzyme activating protein [Coriobacteriales bacterium]|jgi:pyruvate formate lyase activating enzyme
MAEETKELTGRVFDIQGFSVQDGPGIRITVFFKGCPLKCLWCHSPESQRFESEINMLQTKCVGCCRCVQACPTGSRTVKQVGTKDDGSPELKFDINLETCTRCGKCIDACLTQALYWCGEDMTVEDIMKKVRRDKPFFDKSGGGVTVSGGECLMQPDFMAAFLKQCKEEGVNTAVDTCGYVPWENIEKVLPYSDLFLYDIKHMDSAEHKRLTGVPNELILENAKKIAENGGRFHIRIPLITGCNDSVENIEATRDFLLTIKDAVDLVQVLPYHKLGTVKWERLYWKDEATDFETEPPSDEEVEARSQIFRDAGFEVIIH